MPTLAQVLEHKYGPVAGTKQKNPNDTKSNPEMVISSWNHPTIKKPSKAQLKKDFVEYEAFIKQTKKNKKTIQDSIDKEFEKATGLMDVEKVLRLERQLKTGDY